MQVYTIELDQERLFLLPLNFTGELELAEDSKILVADVGPSLYASSGLVGKRNSVCFDNRKNHISRVMNLSS